MTKNTLESSLVLALFFVVMHTMHAWEVIRFIVPDNALNAGDSE